MLLATLALSLIGAGVGYASGRAAYRATASLAIQPATPPGGNEASFNDRVDRYLDHQVALMRHPSILAAAMKDPGWPTRGAPSTLSELSAAFSVIRPVGSPLQIDASLIANERDAATAALTRVFAAYAEAYQREASALEGRVAATRAANDLVKARLDELHGQAQMMRRYPGHASADAALRAVSDEFGQVTDQLAKTNLVLASSPSPGSGSPGDAEISAADFDQLARAAPELAPLREQLIRVESRLAELRRRMGPRAPAVQQAEDERATIRETIAPRLRDLSAVDAEALQTDSEDRPGLRLTPSELRQRQQWLEVRRAELSRELATLEPRVTQARELGRQIEDLARQAERAAAEAAHADAEAAAAGELEVIAEAETAARPYRDTRPPFAGAGAAAGALFGLVGTPLLLLLDRRMRRPESADLADPAAPLYGAVPQLAEGAEQNAEITALAIHEIRGLMQIRARQDGAKAFAITSPSRGSGKTSLTVGLASSLALSGTRTLLVDCDLAGRVATAGGSRSDSAADGAPKQNLDQVMLQMGFLDESDPEVFLLAHDASVGITGMLDGAPLSQCVIETSVPGLSVLPALSATQQHIGRMSGAFVRRLIDEAAGRAGDTGGFDIIIFDTGPVPGSVEGLFVTSEADAVILVASRGENQCRFDQAVAYLKVAGAKLAGTVFNRAVQSDLRIEGARLPKRARDAAPSQTPLLPAPQLTGSGLLAAAVHAQADRVIAGNGAHHESREQAQRRRRPPGGPAVEQPPPPPAREQLNAERNAEVHGLLNDMPAPPTPTRRAARNGAAAPPPRQLADDGLEEALDELVNEVRMPPRHRVRPIRPPQHPGTPPMG